MTVAENICLTLGFPRRFGHRSTGTRRARAPRPRWTRSAPTSTPTPASRRLSRTEKSLVAIARALAAEAEILVLDEPTASLPADEVARLFAALRRLRARGVGMIYVSHRLDEVFEIADRMVVLRDGRVVGERRVSETTPEEMHPADRRPRAVAGLHATGAARGIGAARLRSRHRRIARARSTAACARARWSASSACAAPARKASAARCSGLRR